MARLPVPGDTPGAYGAPGLGRGERVWDGLEALEDRFRIEAVNSPSGVTHVTLSRTG
jgi:hypothetical protein